jgi:acyl-coenzyme A thioesterase PaaI-like protein
MRFDEATAVEAIGENRFRAHIHEGWDIGGNANGGYLMALASRALMAASGRPDVITMTSHFLSPGRVGVVIIEATPIKAGKRFATAQATVKTEEGKPVITVLAATGDVSDTDGLTRAEPPVELPAPDRCFARPPLHFEHGFHERFDVRIHPDDAHFNEGTPSDQALMRGWIRPHDGEPIDGTLVIQAFDAFPPNVFNITDIGTGWVPTVELTAHVRARPVGEWLRCRFTTRFIAGGMFEEDGEIWDENGTFVGQSRQLALLPRLS